MRLLFIFLIFTQIVSCQNSNKDKISIAFIKPNTAKIDNSLRKYIELVEKEYQQQDDLIKKDLTEFIESENEFQLIDSEEFEELKKSAKAELRKIDSLDIERRKFNYYEYLSFYSKSILKIAVEQNGDSFEISEIVEPNIKNSELIRLAKIKKIDFIIKFDNLKTTRRYDSLLLSSNLILYSLEKDKIILEKKIYGSMENSKQYFTCNNPLSCLFVNMSKNALDVYLPEIIKAL